jgi:hypothetical protein
MNLPAINSLQEAIHYLQLGHDGTALTHVDVARSLLLPKIYERIPYSGPPENDPNRSEADRDAWRAARRA